ncbi:bifunctional heptose 7-phosphate kinase/heptose 1-phosphate adenyltransferase [Aquirufa antheringensis]|uniref:bifunctional heptose 7-phosphate kinase/heptose 1-phosphate adenyltransferase n=1 Tax=Aquirufa antheringensis TaxID=2516559 RepID=UPI001032A853|nr:bifunctional ADP-heptose synthase [Aquirufa antheringensis]TBH70232.1 D-glycero-beta-D-manno-heptose-7-phosphate kinase [Aquirufa antheringensis]
MNPLSTLIEKFSSLRVLVIGDLMVDAYTWGKVNRISPEAPVPVVNVIKRESRLGGAGNVVLNIASLGAKPYVCSVIGDDSTGETLQGILQAAGLSTSGIITEKGRPTTVKERVIAGSQQLIRVDSETEAPVSLASSKALLEQVKAWLPEVDVILFEDYDKGVLSTELIQEIILMAKAKQIPTVVDPKKKNFFAYSGATLFKPNLNELRDGLGLDASAIAPEAIAKTVADFKAAQSFTGLFVTMSERGVYMDFATDQIQIPAHIRQIADVSGAGDTVISIAACALAAGGSAAQIAELANLGGGLVCESLGVVPIDVELLKKEAAKI